MKCYLLAVCLALLLAGIYCQEEVKAKESQPEESQAGESQREETKAEEKQAEESQPEDSQPDETQAEESQAEDSQGEESQEGDNGARNFYTYNGEESDFPAAWLKAHNDLRALHGVPALVWDEDLAAGSAEWALVQARNESFNHDTDNGGRFGENLFQASSSLTDFIGTPAEATYNWYEEEWVPGYTYNAGVPPTKGAGHFTQVVWKDTSNLGCGGATYFSDTFYRTMYVCRYTPPANILTDEAFNTQVLPRPDDVPAPQAFAEIDLTCHDQSSDCEWASSLCPDVTWLQEYCPVTCDSCT